MPKRDVREYEFGGGAYAALFVVEIRRRRSPITNPISIMRRNFSRSDQQNAARIALIRAFEDPANDI